MGTEEKTKLVSVCKLTAAGQPISEKLLIVWIILSALILVSCGCCNKLGDWNAGNLFFRGAGGLEFEVKLLRCKAAASCAPSGSILSPWLTSSEQAVVGSPDGSLGWGADAEQCTLTAHFCLFMLKVLLSRGRKGELRGCEWSWQGLVTDCTRGLKATEWPMMTDFLLQSPAESLTDVRKVGR